MKKKGFTLVELLAVIAILAILMLLIMPNVLSMFNKGKKDIFKVQVQSIIKAAETQRQSDLINRTVFSSYCESDRADCKKLETTTEEADFKIDFNSNNKVDKVAIGSGNYCYINSSYNGEIDSSDYIENAQLVCISGECYCVGGSSSYKLKYWTAKNPSEGLMYEIASSLNKTYDNINDLNLESNDVYAKTVVNSSNVAMGNQICLVHNNKTFCLGGGYIISNDDGLEKTTEKLSKDMEKAFGKKPIECATDLSDPSMGMIICAISDLDGCFILSNGDISCIHEGKGCATGTSGIAECAID